MTGWQRITRKSRFPWYRRCTSKYSLLTLYLRMWTVDIVLIHCVILNTGIFLFVYSPFLGTTWWYWTEGKCSYKQPPVFQKTCIATPDLLSFLIWLYLFCWFVWVKSAMSFGLVWSFMKLLKLTSCNAIHTVYGCVQISNI